MLLLYQYSAEKCHLERIQLRTKSGSDEALKIGEQMMALKKKQVQLHDSVIDSIKVGLETKFNKEEETLITMASFPTDRVDLKVEEMNEITCELIEHFTPHKNFKVSEFLAIYLGQPWLIEQALDDVKMEEALKTKNLELDQLNIEMDAFKKRAEESIQQLDEINQKISDLQTEIENQSFYGGVGDEPDDEKQQRLFILDTLKSELKKRESELAISTKLNDQRIEQGGPAQEKIDNLATDIEIQTERLEARRKDRTRLAALYFDMEEEMADHMVDMLTDETAQLEHELHREEGLVLELEYYFHFILCFYIGL